MKQSIPSAKGRAFLCLIVLIGFYVLAIAISGLCLWGAWWGMSSGRAIRLAIPLLCLAGIILYNFFPRREPAPPPPGLRLDPDDQPELFGLVDDLAAEIRQEPPENIYLVTGVNAAVWQQGTVLGLGGRRQMMVGLQILQALSVEEFRSVLAHEFGHYKGGDTRLGALIYGTRTAIGRTIQKLAEAESVAQILFRAYGNFYLKLTYQVARAQEFAADAFAARVTHADTCGRALQRVHVAGAALDAFSERELNDVCAAGHRPKLIEGFHRYAHSPVIVDAMRQVHGAILEQTEPAEGDTHPPLAQRLAALGQPPAFDGVTVANGASALSLLREPERLEQELIRTVLGPRCDDWPILDWDDAPAKVYRQRWNETSEALAPYFVGITPEQLPDLAAAPAAFLQSAFGETAGNPDEDRNALLLFATRILAETALRRGIPVETPLGEHVVIGGALVPFQTLAVDPAAVDRDAWNAACEKAGLAGVDLGRFLGAPETTAPPAPRSWVEEDEGGRTTLTPGPRIQSRRRRTAGMSDRNKAVTVGAVIAFVAFIAWLAWPDAVAPSAPVPVPIERLDAFERAWLQPGVDALRPFLSKNRNERMFRWLERRFDQGRWPADRPALESRTIEPRDEYSRVRYKSSQGPWRFTWRRQSGQWIVSGIDPP